MAEAQRLEELKARADKILEKFKGRPPLPNIIREIELRLRTAMRKDFPDLAKYHPTIIFREGIPTIFLVESADAANSNTRAK